MTERQFEEMTPKQRQEKRRYYQEMITKHLAARNEEWVSRYNAQLALLNKIDRRKEKMGI